MIVEKVIENKKKNIKNYPCYVNRASQIGDPCLRRLVYERTNYKDKRLHDIGLELIFEEGREQEKIVLKDLKEAGFDIVEQQRAYQWPEFQISGSIDAKIVLDGKAYPLEIKSMSPYIFAAINTMEDFKKYPWTKKYISQIMIYLLLAEEEKGYFILKNKSTGELKEIEVTLDYTFSEEVVRKAEAINKHIADKTLPDKINDFDICGECPFSHICLPELDMGAGVKIENREELEAKLEERERLQKYSKLYDELDKEIKGQIKEIPALALGKWMITGKWIEKKEYVSPASKYWQSKIVRLKGE
jgi:CRISPR/Cas system-associated exonuclease Cas4 (RecB family)